MDASPFKREENWSFEIEQPLIRKKSLAAKVDPLMDTASKCPGRDRSRSSQTPRRSIMNRNTGMNAGQVIGSMNGLQVVALDIAKQVFQMHTVEMNTGEIVNVQLKRAKVLERFANKPACLIAIEACGGAHYWARESRSLGHSVRLLHAKIVRPFVSGNKTDATDVRAIWLAVQQAGVKFVGIKTTAQQAILTLHRQREALMKMRIIRTNALRGLLYEFGATFAKGKNALLKEIEMTLDGPPGCQTCCRVQLFNC